MDSKILRYITVCVAFLALFVYGLVLFTNSNSSEVDEPVASRKLATDTVAGTQQDVVESKVSNSEILGEKTMEDKQSKYQDPPKTLSSEALAGKQSIIETEKGTIVIELFGEEAPIAVSNHIFLVNEKFYDGLTFHRREEGFVLQGGDPLGSGFGGPGYTFEDEPVSRSYDRGIVAMANSGPNTNGSQFFIMLSDYPLPPQYTIFGKVVEGMEVVDELQIGDKMLSLEIK